MKIKQHDQITVIVLSFIITLLACNALMPVFAADAIASGQAALPAYGDACFVELKAGKGRLTRTQEDWGEWLAQHYRHRICRSLDDLRAALKVWGTM